MIIYQVETHVHGLSKEKINQELSAIDDILDLTGGGLFCAELTVYPGWVNILLRASGEWIVSDILDSTDFTVKRITAIGVAHETYVTFRGWRTPQAHKRKKAKDYLIDFNPHHHLVSRHGHSHIKLAGYHAASPRFLPESVLHSMSAVAQFAAAN